MKVNISKAAEMVGVTRATLYRHIDKKGISVEKDNDGNPLIDASELVRVYGDKVDFSEEAEHVDTSLSSKNNNVTNNKTDEINALKKQLELLETSSKREREILEDQIGHLRETLSKAQDGQNKLTLLLENKNSGAGDWEKSFRALEQRLANQEKSAKDREEKEQRLLKQNRGLKQALEAEKNKSFWQKLFG